MSIKFLLLGGGVFWVFLGGGIADFVFMGARIFLNLPGSDHATRYMSFIYS